VPQPEQEREAERFQHLRRAGFQLLLGPGTSGGRHHLPLLGHRRRDMQAEIYDWCAARASHPACTDAIHPSRPTHRSRTLPPPCTAHRYALPCMPRLQLTPFCPRARRSSNLPVHQTRVEGGAARRRGGGGAARVGRGSCARLGKGEARACVASELDPREARRR